MDNNTAAPGDDYDVLIVDDLNTSLPEQCKKYDPSLLAAWVLPKLYATVFTFCLLGNLVVVFILVKCKRLGNVNDIYFLNLALSNLLFSLALPFWAYAASGEGGFGDCTHKVLIGINAVGFYGEVCFNMILTMRRRLMPHPSSKARSVSCGIRTSVLAWTVAVLISLPESLIYSARMEGQEANYSFSIPHLLPVGETFWKYFLTLKMNILGLLFPLFLFGCVGVRKRNSFKDSKNGFSNLVFAIIVVFLLMWTPYNIALLLSTFKGSVSLGDCERRYGLDQGVQITEIIAATHCCVIPLLHVIFNQDFRRLHSNSGGNLDQ